MGGQVVDGDDFHSVGGPYRIQRGEQGLAFGLDRALMARVMTAWRPAADCPFAGHRYMAAQPDDKRFVMIVGTPATHVARRLGTRAESPGYAGAE